MIILQFYNTPWIMHMELENQTRKGRWWQDDGGLSLSASLRWRGRHRLPQHCVLAGRQIGRGPWRYLEETPMSFWGPTLRHSQMLDKNHQIGINRRFSQDLGEQRKQRDFITWKDSGWFWSNVWVWPPFQRPEPPIAAKEIRFFWSVSLVRGQATSPAGRV